MESAEKLLHQLHSLESLRGVVRTMKSLAAANIRQYQVAVESLGEYYRSVELGMRAVAQGVGSQALAGDASPQRALVAFGSDHGLCGRFNESVANRVQAVCESASCPQQERIPLLLVGTRLADYFIGSGGPTKVEDTLLVPGSAATMTSTVQEILLWIDRWHSQMNIGHIDLLANTLSPGGGYSTRLSALLPLDAQKLQQFREIPWPSRSLPVYRMNWQRLFSALLHQYFFVNIFRACAESQQAEHTIRLRTMREAEKNIDQNHAAAVGQYRRVRQTIITNELLDIVAGFEATEVSEDE